MTMLEKQVHRAQRRLWLSRWLADLGWCLVAAAGVFVMVTVVRRAVGAEISAADGWVALGLLMAAGVVATVWMVVRRETAITAATALDEAAGLKERISSGLYCTNNPDPFAQAVYEDAQRVGGALTIRKHIGVRFPRSMAFASGTVVLAALVFWLVEPFETEASQQRLAEAERLERVELKKVALKQQLEQKKKQLAQTNPDIKNLEEFKSLGDLSTGKVDVPSDLVRDQMKKLDSLADAVRRKREAAENEGGMNTLKKMLRQIKTPKETDPAVGKLSSALAQGDFKAASEAIKQMQEQLAKAGDQQNKERTQELAKQLNQLSEKLAELGDNQKLKDEMKKAGLSEEQAKRMLENLNKKDLDQMKKELQKAGLDQKKAQQLAKQMQQRQSACKMCSRLGGAMAQAAQGMAGMQGGDSIKQLQAAADQLNNLEMMEEEMKQLQASLAELDQMKQQMGGQCANMDNLPQQGQGGMGGLGRGRGNIAPEEETKVSFERKREKVKTTRGRIIGQFLVDGQQVSGESKAAFTEAVAAERREASDAIKEARIPKKFQKSVTQYYSLINPDVENESDKQ